MSGGRRKKRGGQAVVELMLILPVFFLMIFFIMEIGNIAFQTIIAHHCAYELARLGSLLAGPKAGGGTAVNLTLAQQKMQNALRQMFPQTSGAIGLGVTTEMTGMDPQVQATSGQHINEDMLVTLNYPVRLVFPGASYFLATPRGSGRRTIIVRVRMPVEKPVFQ